jgi:hypothetical protein
MNETTRNFIKGMGSINLFPPIAAYKEPPRTSPWQVLPPHSLKPAPV